MTAVLARRIASLSSGRGHFKIVPRLYLHGACASQGQRLRSPYLLLQSENLVGPLRKVLALYQTSAISSLALPSVSIKGGTSISDGEDDSALASEGHQAVEKKSQQLGLKAYYIAQSSKVRELVANEVYPARVRSVKDGAAVISLDTLSPSEPLAGNSGDALRKVSERSFRFMVVFDYGAVVFCNIPERDHAEYVGQVRKYSNSPWDTASIKSEDFRISLDETLPEHSHLDADCIGLRSFDLNSLQIICGVLGQSAAVDHYMTKVDAMLDTFTNINADIHRTGNLGIQKPELFQLVAENNSIMMDVIIKLGILERSPTAWKYSHYERIWSSMREEFELTRRFHAADFKLGLIQHNIKFFLGVLQNQKSDKLEWTIIALIALEIIVSLATNGHAIASSAGWGT